MRFVILMLGDFSEVVSAKVGHGRRVRCRVTPWNLFSRNGSEKG